MRLIALLCPPTAGWSRAATVEPGRAADIVAAAGAPVRFIALLQKIASVMKARVVCRQP